MTKRPIVALTGVIGAGKSTVASILSADFGIPIVDADLVAREVVAPGSATLQAVVRRFGPGCLASDGSLDRKRLGAQVFADATARRDLEAIVHPAVRERSRALLQQASEATTAPFVVYMVPLFFEAGGYPEITQVLAVLAEREVCLRRIMERDQCTRELAEKKFDSQLSPSEKRKRATVVIENDGTVDELRVKVHEAIRSGHLIAGGSQHP